MPAGIFVSYRRDDSRHAAGRLADDLADAFGPESIFRDIEGIDPGLDFSRALEKALAGCVVMLVLIGPRWLDLRDAQGRRRLEQDGDWIRQEISTALAREVRVIPVLLEGTPLPEPDQLPPDLRPLVQRQWLELADGRWRGDIVRLVDTLARVPGLQRRDRAGHVPPVPGASPLPPAAPPVAAAPPGRLRPMLVGAGLGVAGLVVVGALVSGRDDDAGSGAGAASPAPSPAPAVAPAADPVPSPAPAPVTSIASERAADAAPRPAPGVAPAPAMAPAPADVEGLWRTTSGETYHFEQQGRDVRFTARAGGQPMGEGVGRLEGGLLRLTLTMQLNGVVLGSVNCDMQGAPDGRSYTGMCTGPNGPFAAQMFR